jgi:predicted permease
MLSDELRLVVRALARQPGAIAAPVAILAAAVTLNALVFSVVRGVLLSRLPFPDASRIAVVQEMTERYGLSRVSYPVLDAWRREARSVDAIVAYTEGELSLMAGTEPVRVRSVATTAGLFDLLDRPLLSGRTLQPEAHEPGAARSVVISERLWRRAFGADPEILSRTVRLEGVEHVVLGVARDGGGFPDDADVWTALEPAHPELMEIAGAKILIALARPRPGVDLEEVARELGAISAGVDGGASSASAVALSDRLLGDVRRPLLLLQSAVLLVLLAASANAGGMLLARGVRRRAELAVRASIGAGTHRLLAGLLLEGVVLGAFAGLIGLGAAAAALKPALSLVPSELPRASAIALDPAVALFALGLAVATGILTALAPALSGSRTRPAALLREASPGGGTSPWLRRLLEGFVVTQVSLAVLLTAGAGLLLRSFVATVSEDPGFDPEHVTVVDVSLPEYRYPDAGSRLAFARELLARAAALPGATAVAIGRNLPISGSTMTSPLAVEGGGQTGGAQIALVSAGYFDVMRIPVIDGAGFDDADREDGPPVLVVDANVRTADGEPVGVGSRAHSYFGSASGPDGMRDVVGVAGAVRHDGLRAAPAPVAYEPFFQKGGAAGFSLLVRSDAPTALMASEARGILFSMDPELLADRVATMEAHLARSVAEPRFYTVVLSVFGALAVLLALAGCQAGLAHRVAARRREIGLRLALGASAPGVRGMVLRRGLALTAAGVLVGLVLSVLATRLLESQLYGVSATDPITYGGLLLVLFAGAALASDLPARRASSVDPVETLREG